MKCLPSLVGCFKKVCGALDKGQRWQDPRVEEEAFHESHQIQNKAQAFQKSPEGVVWGSQEEGQQGLHQAGGKELAS